MARWRLSATSSTSLRTLSRACATESLCSLRARFFQFSNSAATRSIRSFISSRSISSAAARSSGLAGGSSCSGPWPFAAWAPAPSVPFFFPFIFDSSLIAVGSFLVLAAVVLVALTLDEKLALPQRLAEHLGREADQRDHPRVVHPRGA